MMGVLVSMGGLIFGYDTGQISGFLAMDDFLRRFGTLDPSTGKYVFSDVRSGLIVGMVCLKNLILHQSLSMRFSCLLAILLELS